MRLCRIQLNGTPQAAYYDEERIIPLSAALAAFNRQSGPKLDLPAWDDLLDFLEHPQPKRQKGINAGGFLPHHSGAQHQPVGDDLGLLRGLAQNWQEETG